MELPQGIVVGNSACGREKPMTLELIEFFLKDFFVQDCIKEKTAVGLEKFSIIFAFLLIAAFKIFCIVGLKPKNLQSSEGKNKVN